MDETEDYAKGASEAVDEAGPKETGETMDEGMHHEQHETIHIPKDMLPQGMAEDVNVDDILEFRVVGKMDADGDVPVEYNHGKDKEDSYAKEAAAAVSPQNKDNPGDDGAGY